MLRTYTAEQIRTAEAVALTRVGDRPLMLRAARAMADAVLARLPSPVPGRRAVLLAGAGNNGGDALYAGVTLRRRGMGVTAVLAHPDRAHSAGLAALLRAGGRAVAASDAEVPHLIAGADAVLDGLVGLGVRPPLRAPADRLVTLAGEADGLRVAVDLPSGIDPDTGGSDGPVFHADVTVTVGGVKTGLVMSGAAGEVVLADIGMDPARLAADAGHDANIVIDSDAARLVPGPGADDHKYSTGVVGIAAGSDRYPGAALLAVGGAVRLRPGLVRFAGPDADAVVRRWPEVVAAATVVDAGRVQAWVVGPGIGTDGPGLARLRDVLMADVPVLVDADGLTLLAGHPQLLADRRRRGMTTVLTPHSGEFARLFPDLDTGIDTGARLASVRAAAHRSGAVVLLKGHRTAIADPAGRLAINMSGSPWLATAGSGDVLSGMAGSLLAGGMDPWAATAVAAHLHGRAGERAEAQRAPGASGLLAMLAR